MQRIHADYLNSRQRAFGCELQPLAAGGVLLEAVDFDPIAVRAAPTNLVDGFAFGVLRHVQANAGKGIGLAQVNLDPLGGVCTSVPGGFAAIHVDSRLAIRQWFDDAIFISKSDIDIRQVCTIYINLTSMSIFFSVMFGSSLRKKGLFQF